MLSLKQARKMLNIQIKRKYKAADAWLHGRGPYSAVRNAEIEQWRRERLVGAAALRANDKIAGRRYEMLVIDDPAPVVFGTTWAEASPGDMLRDLREMLALIERTSAPATTFHNPRIEDGVAKFTVRQVFPAAIDFVGVEATINTEDV